MIPYPLKFHPIFKERLWGGHALQTVFHKDLPPQVNIGESWELADLPQDQSRISNGSLAGKTLREVVNRYTEVLTGQADFPLPFPLLIKFLDARDLLSVQVHPDPETSLRSGRGNPKTECWYIIRAEPGAYIYKGLKPGATREQFRNALYKGTVEELLVKTPAQVGECHFLPSGTVHAIGAGLLIAEIQQPSDTTYRVFDWNRTDNLGHPRELHIDQALDNICFDSSPEELAVRSVGRLVDCEFFKVDKGHLISGAQKLLSPGLMRIHIILSGHGTYDNATTESVPFQAGDCVLIPARYQGVMQFIEEGEFLIVTV